MPAVRHWLCVSVAVGLTGCAVVSPDALLPGKAAKTPRSHPPVFRFAMYDKQMAEFQYIGAAGGAGRRMKRLFPQTPGPMPVDCESFVEFGVTIVNRRHKFQFAVTDAWGDPIDERHFTYRRWLRTGALAGQVRFRERPDDGVYKIVVSHRGRVLHEENFLLNGCSDDSQPGTIRNLAHVGEPERMKIDSTASGAAAMPARTL